jgi:hypothetical protein
MADAVTSRVLIDTPTHYAIHLTNISDGTGESAVAKIDKSTLTDSSNPAVEPDSLDIVAVRWNMQGFTYVKLLWDHNTDDTALVLSGSGYDDFMAADGSIPGLNRTEGLKDPRSTGGPGDLLLTTVGATSGSTYDITIWVRKNPA